jgi:hypothetical protein
MNKSMEIVFDLIKIRFDLMSPQILPLNFNSKRWIRGEALEIDWLSNCKIKSNIEISHEIRFALIEYDNNKYFIAIGLEDPDFLPSGLSQFQLNSGCFTTLIAELEVPVKSSISILTLEDKILSQNVDESFYEGHELTDLLSIFPNIFISEITNQYAIDENNLNQLVCNYLTVNSRLIALPFKDVTLNKINELILLNSKILSYETIIQALFSSQFKFAFLDLYRCIELLYQLIHIDEAYSDLLLNINRTDFLIAIEGKLNWRPIERTSLTKIYNDTPLIYKKDLGIAVKSIDSNIKDYSSWLYDLRCNVVHLKSVQRKFDLKSENWERLILGVTGLLCYWYSKYKNFD